MIEVKDLTFKFGNKTVLENVNVRFRDGEFVLIAGNNGAGKSTFLKCLMGIISPTGGEIRFDKNLSRKKIGFVTDRLSLFENLSIQEAIALHCRVYGISSFNDELLGQLELDKTGKVKDLSVGERTMLLFSLVMAQEPELLLIDEIMHALDPYIREMFLDSLLDTITRHGTTVVAVNHTFSEIEKIPERVLVLENHHFILDEKTDVLKTKIKKVEMGPEDRLVGDIPVIYKSETPFHREYFIYPFEEEMRRIFQYDFQDLKLEEIMKSFIGGYYVKKRVR